VTPDGFYDIVQMNEDSDKGENKYSDTTYDLSNTRRKISGREAVGQAVKMILSTERLRYPIYCGEYGIESQDLSGLDCDYVCVELQRRIEEALMSDERVTGVSGFKFDVRKNAVFVEFVVHTIWGELNEGREFDFV
jgi:hypothetical protein